MLRRAVAAVAAIISLQRVGVLEWPAAPEWGEASAGLAGTGEAETAAATGKAETGVVVAIGAVAAIGAVVAIGTGNMARPLTPESPSCSADSLAPVITADPSMES